METESLFREVFREAGVRHDLLDLFEDVTIDRVVVKRAKAVAQVHISYDHLIRKEHIYRLEHELDERMFQRLGLHCHIVEDYHLTSRYDAAYVVENYRDSLLLEVERNDHLLHTILRRAQVLLVGDELQIVLPDTYVARQNEQRILEVYDRIYGERFHLDIRPAIQYRQVDDHEEREAREAEQRSRIEAMSCVAMHQRDAERADGMEDAGSGGDGSLDDVIRAHGGADGDDDVDGGASSEKSGCAGAGAKSGGTGAGAKSGGAGAGTKSGGVARGASSGKEGAAYGKGGASYGRGGRGRGRSDGPRPVRLSDHPDVIYGRDFEEECVTIESLAEGGTIDAVTVRGEVLAVEVRKYKKSDGTEHAIVKYTITDYSDTIKLKIFIPAEALPEVEAAAKTGDFLKVRGTPEYDNYDKEQGIGRIYGIKKIPDFREVREDTAIRKRVELHCHTKMSDMDGCADVKALIKMAKRFGHKAMAITDHGVVQAFPDAAHALEKGDDFRLLYGCEAYLVDDTKTIVTAERGQTLADDYVVFDIETTGFVPKYNKIIEIGAVKVRDGEIVDRFSEYVNPEVPIPLEIEKLTSIKDADVEDADTIEAVLPRFLEFCSGAVLVAHNARFDTSFIRHYATQLGLTYDYTHTDTIELARLLMKRMGKYTLDHLAKELGIPQFHHHRAVDDAEATAQIFVRFVSMLRERGIETLAQLNDAGTLPPEKVADLYPYHAVLLAKNEVGRRNLYRLVSYAHLKSFHRVPKIPKSMLGRYREGLLVGSGCSSGELYQAIINERTEEEIAQIVEYYDYLEVQPVANNRYLLERAKLPTLQSEEDLRQVNRRIVRYGEQYGKLVCATGDVHFLHPENAISRTLILSARKSDRVYNEAESLYFKTTDEMLEDFAYLGVDKAEEIVVINTNLIADMCDTISPVRPDKCPPVIADSDKTLRTICYTKAHEMYGDELPQIVKERLEKELKSIIGNGYAVMYIIAQKLVWKSVEDGYLVGSRGSVGSSFVATMAGITEVNPLSPHYYCPECHYSDFSSEEVKAYAGKAGCDMPDKVCPVCGAALKKDGFDIPFETFLGFKGDKEPDIDLNFSGEYQSKAHKYTEVIFGAGQTYRAGTVGTVAEKTAYGYVNAYYRDHEVVKKRAELERLAAGIVGIRRTTGQHPGGIVVLPVGEDIDSFTPMQHPANDMSSDIVTTHFDYHKIEHNLLKLDILGHDDPTMIRMLQDLTGVDPLTIPLDDPQVMTLFQSTEALGVKPEDIQGTKLGTLGIPEFGTNFAMGMLWDAKPLAFSDLVRISGLSHGEGLWVGNAKDLIQEGIATISTAVCTRDDIMTYLISKGLENERSFKIMESVRKGKGLTDEWVAEMEEHGVPDWYIGSCKKITYMFPKAHAAAYVMMAWRIAYCKINYPLEYYCAFFSIRAKGFSYEKMCLGKARCEEYLAEYRKLFGDKLDDDGEGGEDGGYARAEAAERGVTRSYDEDAVSGETEADPADAGRDGKAGKKDEKKPGVGGKPSAKDKLVYRDLRIVQEMYARGFSFWPIDLYRSKASSFQVIDGKIMPSFTSIEGLGDKNAEMIEYEASRGPFLSKDDFAQRTHTSQTMVETLTRLGVLDGLTDSNQISLFDMI